MTITPANEQQCLQVKNWFADHHAIYTWGGPNMTYPMSNKTFLKLLSDKHFNSFCLLNDKQQLLAFGQYYRRLEHHHLGRLAVNPIFRGKGLAKILINALLEQAYLHDSSAKGASLFVFRDNEIAYRCYQSLGFVETDYPEPHFPGNMENCAYMRKPNTSNSRPITR